MDTVADEETIDELGSVVQLLHRAAVAVWKVADDGPPGSALHDLGLGIFLARSVAAGMLPEDYTASSSSPATTATDPRGLLTSAEEFTRALPVADVNFPGVCDLVLQVCDLVRDADDLLPTIGSGDG